ncbi:MAG: hypothetical protein L6V81_08575 [Clostridium sp.]|nr:MAG: hypothetical protein L6V81_08575 [Clostridium sp.]
MVKYVNNNFPEIRVVGHKNGYQEDETIVENEIIKIKTRCNSSSIRYTKARNIY